MGAKAKGLGLSITAFPGSLTGNSEMEQLGLRIGIPMDVDAAGGALS